MKTIESIDKEISQLRKIALKVRSKGENDRIQIQRIEFLKEAKNLLLTNPSEDFLKRELKMLNDRIHNIHNIHNINNGFKAWYQGAEANYLKSNRGQNITPYLNEMGAPLIRKQIDFIEFVLN